MIPVTLSLKGLYSYRERQIIDFSQLTASQLFGIFGSVGCGKSSILEAIMFVLFDRSDRLNQKDNRYYNMLNLQSDEMEIDFTFRAESNSKSVYRFYFRAGRNRNNYDQVVLRDRNYYKDEEGNWLPIAVKDASELLGMNYDNFMQTVIIPQGKFREFVDQGATQRTQMLKELFQLNQYELGSKVKILSQKNTAALSEVQGRLAEIGGVGEEAVEEAQQNIKRLEAELKTTHLQAKELEEKCQEQEVLRKLFDDISSTEAERKRLDEQKESFALKEVQLRDYSRAYTFFKDRFQRQHDSKKEIESLEKQLEVLHTKIAQQKAELQSAREVYKKRQQDYDQRETDILKCQDLEYVIKIRAYKDELQAENQKSEKLQADVQVLQQKLLTTKEQLGDKEKELEEMDAKLRHRTTLQEVNYWHQQNRSFQQEKQACEVQKKEYLQQIERLRTQKAERVSTFDWASDNPEISTLKKLIQEHLQQNKEKLTQLSKQMQDLQIREKLAQYADSLEGGKPCPLCGSEHHPQVVQHQSVHEEIHSLSLEQKKMETSEAQLRQLGDDLSLMEGDFKSTITLLKKAEAEAAQVDAKITEHQQAFRWENFRQYKEEDIQQFLQRLENIAERSDSLRKQVQVQKKEIPVLEEQHQQEQEKLRQHQQQEQNLNTSIKNLLSLLKVYEYEGWKNHALPELKESLERGRQKVDEIAEKYNQAVNHRNDCEKELHGSLSRAESEKERLENIRAKLHQLNTEIESLCEDKNFESLEQIRELLALQLDMEVEQQRIQQYKMNVSAVDTHLQKLLHEAADKSYQKEEHEAIKLNFHEIKQQLEKLQGLIAVAKDQLKRIQEKLENSRQLQKKQQYLLQREDNLKEMASLFKGSGFVKYVSSVYLDNLCRTANERFMKLTRNNLSLELNEDGEFIVRDFLNNGKTRLLKTLSGGQTFQAALCLALALAENVKSLNQAEQSFFFLDEGFGSLDKESLRLVFDTLKSLRQEHRIVGIISHVEELQQEIDVYLKIVNDKERGSLISRSWEA